MLNKGILIASDIRLGKLMTMYGLKAAEIRQTLRDGFSKRIRTLIDSEGPEAVFLIGNLFASNMYSDKDISLLQDVFDRGIEFYIIPPPDSGEKDLSIYNKISFSDNVHILTGEELKIKDEDTRYHIRLMRGPDLPDNLSESDEIIFYSGRIKNGIRTGGSKIIACSGQFEEDDDIIHLPVFDICDDISQREPGCVLLKDINGILTSTFIPGKTLGIAQISIDISDKTVQDIDDTIREFSGDRNILSIELNGNIGSREMLDYINDFKKRYEKKTYYLICRDNTGVAESLLREYPEHLEGAHFIKNVKNGFQGRKDRDKMIDKVLKYGLRFYEDQ